MARILVVEDEAHIANGLKFNLELDGHDVAVVGDGQVAYDLVATQQRGFDLLVLDVMLPTLSGFDVCRAIRKKGIFVPVLMLTAKNFDKDKIHGLQVGADDYVTKPFNLEELLARVSGLLRRREWDRARSAGPIRLEFAQVSLDFERAEATIAGVPAKLTSLEFAVMRCFAEREGKVVSREELMVYAWGLEGPVNTRTVDNFIMRLRRILEPDPARPRHLLSVRGLGYRFVRE